MLVDPQKEKGNSAVILRAKEALVQRFEDVILTSLVQRFEDA
jgi:hypothetical protein